MLPSCNAIKVPNRAEMRKSWFPIMNKGLNGGLAMKIKNQKVCHLRHCGAVIQRLAQSVAQCYSGGHPACH
jgi:hypothetical protein